MVNATMSQAQAGQRRCRIDAGWAQGHGHVFISIIKRELVPKQKYHTLNVLIPSHTFLACFICSYLLAEHYFL
jgi:hypothetical protein